MSYLKIKKHYQTSPYNRVECVPTDCSETKKKGKCALKGDMSDYIVLKADDIESINASIEKRDQNKAADCIIFKKKYEAKDRKIILIIELKAQKDPNCKEIREKLENSGTEIKKIFEKSSINWGGHQTNFVLLTKDVKKMKISKKKQKGKNKKKGGKNDNELCFDGKKKKILVKSCDISIEDIWY